MVRALPVLAIVGLLVPAVAPIVVLVAVQGSDWLGVYVDVLAWMCDPVITVLSF